VRRFTVAIVFFFGTAVQQLQGQVVQRPLKVASCTEADSLLGPLGNDRRGVVRGFYSPEGDQTFLTAGSAAQSMGQGHYFSGTIRYFGAKPITAGDSLVWATAETSVAFFLRGRPGLQLQESGSPPPGGGFVADDSVVDVGSPQLGEYHGPPEMTVVPLNYPVPYRSLVQLAQANSIVLRLGDSRYKMSSDDRRNLRAMLRIALCTGAGEQ